MFSQSASCLFLWDIYVLFAFNDALMAAEGGGIWQLRTEYGSGGRIVASEDGILHLGRESEAFRIDDIWPVNMKMRS